MNVAAIVPAAGVGKRLKARVHKPFLSLDGRPMLAWTLAALEGSPSVQAVVVAAHRRDLKAVRRLVSCFRFRKVIAVVAGGKTRTESVYAGLKALPTETEWVIVHDAARPLVSPQLVERTIHAARRHQAAVAAVPVVPTIKQASDRWVTGTLDRNRLWAAQTPQAFRRRLLEGAHRRARSGEWAATDDAALVEMLGVPVRIVMGSSRNLKVTTPEDLVIANALLHKGSG